MSLDIVNDGALEVGEFHVVACVVDGGLDAENFMEFDCTVSRLNYNTRIGTKVILWLETEANRG